MHFTHPKNLHQQYKNVEGNMICNTENITLGNYAYMGPFHIGAEYAHFRDRGNVLIKGNLRFSFMQVCFRQGHFYPKD
jgi:hypothetical protein